MRKRQHTKSRGKCHLPGQKPRGCFQKRVERVGGNRFAMIAVDVGKPEACVQVFDYYGKVLVEPFSLAVTGPGLEGACGDIRKALEDHGMQDWVCVVETTGRYHLPIRKIFEKHLGETRNLHPFTTSQVRKSCDWGNKTDQTDLAAIHRAALLGLAMTNEVLSDQDKAWRILTRHRRDLVEKAATLKVQLKEMIHAYLPGFTALWPADHFWESPIGVTMATVFASAEAIEKASDEEFIEIARSIGTVIRGPTIQRIRVWAAQAAPADDAANIYHRRAGALWKDLRGKQQEIADIELDLALFLCQSPFVLLTAFPGINVVSASDYGAELGPIINYATSKSIAGRAGLYPSRYQSSEAIDLADGPLIARRNRQLRAALMRISRNLRRNNDYYKAKAFSLRQQNKSAHTHVIIARMFSRLSFHVVSGHVIDHPALQTKHAILQKLIHFFVEHNASADLIATALANATAQLPRCVVPTEGNALRKEQEEILHKRRPRTRVRQIGEIIAETLLRLAEQYPEDIDLHEAQASQPQPELIEDATRGT